MAGGFSGRASADALRYVDQQTRGHGDSHRSENHGSAPRSRDHAPVHSAPSQTYPRSSGVSHSTGTSWQPRGTYTRDDDCGHFAHSTCVDESLGALFVMYTFGMPWTVPHLYDRAELLGYAPYPFADGPGVLRLAADSTPELAAREVRQVALALDVESGYQLEGVLPATLALRLLLPHRFELDSRVSLLSDLREHPTELAAASTAHVLYRFAQGQRFDFRMGLGVRNFRLDVPRWGVDLMYAVDGYIAHGLVLRIELHLGSVKDAFVGQARATLGYMLGRSELFVGYDHTAYRGSGSATLGGPIAGVRLWF